MPSPIPLHPKIKNFRIPFTAFACAVRSSGGDDTAARAFQDCGRVFYFRIKFGVDRLGINLFDWFVEFILVRYLIIVFRYVYLSCLG